MTQVNIFRPNSRLYEQLMADPNEADFPLDSMPAQRFFELNDPETVASIDLPDPVRACAGILRANGIWHTLTQNDEAFSCADAAEKRWERGRAGINMKDELKSWVGRIKSPGDGPIYVAAHLSAADRIDMKSLKELLGSKTSPVEADELAENLGAQFGTVNPVLLSENPDVLQVWDTDVARRWHRPMHTNAGHHKFALEFLPVELFNELPHKKASYPLTERSQRMDLIED